VSDIEHELVVDLGALQARVEVLSDFARRAIAAAIRAQEVASSTHEAWLDEALLEVDAT